VLGRSVPPSAGLSRVLVVEDEPALARFLERVLLEEEFQPLVERRGDTGLRAALEHHPDAVILDLALPGLDGLDVCRELRARGVRVPVILLTARDAVPDRGLGLDGGADDYLVKPFAIEELLARLRSHLRRRLSAPERIQVGDLVLEPATRLVRRGHRQIELTLQEFGLLELLIRHPNQVMTRQRILDHVWGYDARPASNVVDIYIHYLRDKVDRGEDRALIHTVRTLGYVLRA
jgi:DNA-binding response OmpR family regulator